MIHKKLRWVVGVLTLPIFLYAQPSNDDCFGAILISNPVNYCSGITEFTNINALDEGIDAAQCFGGQGGDVWFSFVSVASTISIAVNGNTLTNPAVALYTTPDCQYFTSVGGGLACAADNAGLGGVQLIWNGIAIGQTHYIRIQGLANNQGDFQLCLNNFFQPAEPGSDFVTGAVLCDQSPFTVDQISGVGLDPDEGNGSCLTFGSTSETQSVWYRWIAGTSGSLEFSLEPININDDLDFVLYEFPSGIDDPSGKVELSCNATFGGNGESCGPNTGLRAGESGNVEDGGCDPGENGFNAPIQLEAGKVYGLLVNNFSQSGLGFDVSFGGSAEFQGPEPNFQLNTVGAFECDKSIIIDDLSMGTGLDNIVSRTWIFGEGATPSTGTGIGPHTVVFESFGTKTIVLTVKSEKGCIVSTTETVEIESCCADFDAISTSAPTTDVLCFGDSTGVIEMSSLGGNPPYNYSINGGRFLPFDRFNNIPAGVYTIVAQDIKGCENSVTVEIIQPEQLVVDAGEDISLQLTESGQILATAGPPSINFSISWSPPDSMSCTDCLDPITTTFISRSYTITITDDNGCTASDSVFVEVIVEDNSFAPDAFTPNDDLHNERYNIYAGRGSNVVLELRIFNRWGDLVFDGVNQSFGIKNGQSGWDGTFNGIDQPTGIYVYFAKIQYLDGTIFEKHGNFTLIR